MRDLHWSPDDCLDTDLTYKTKQLLILRVSSEITAREIEKARSGAGGSAGSGEHPAISHPDLAPGERIVESGLVYMDDWTPELFERLRGEDE